MKSRKEVPDMITDIITTPGAAFTAFRDGAGTGSFVTSMNSLVHTGS